MEVPVHRFSRFSFLVLSFALCSVWVLGISRFARAAPLPEIIVSEIAWRGSVKSTADEWVELANLSNDAVDLTGWSLSGASTTPLLLSGLIPPHQTYLISNYPKDHEKTVLLAEPSLVTSAISVSNETVQLRLYDTQGQEKDRVDVEKAALIALPDVFATLTRSPVDPTIWEPSETSVFLSDVAHHLGTPGQYTFPLVEDEEETQEILIADPKEMTFVLDPIVSSPIPDVAPNEPEIVVEEVAHIEIAPETTKPIETPPTEAFESSAEEVSSSLLEVSPGEAPAVAMGPPTISDPPTDIAVLETIARLPEVLHIEEIAQITNPEESILPSTNTTTTTLVEIPLEVFPTTPPSSTASTSSINSEDSRTGDALEIVSDPGLRICELFPKPASGAKEWVELCGGRANLVLNGWKLRDASGALTDLSAQQTDSSGYLLIENPKGKLNNEQETIELVNAEGVVQSTVSYGGELASPATGTSLAWIAGAWVTDVVPTPSEPPIVTIPPSAHEASTETSATTAVAETHDAVLTTTSVAMSAKEALSEQENVTTVVPEIVEDDPLTAPASTSHSLRPPGVKQAVMIIEVLPAPHKDAPEEIVLKNQTDQEVDLSQWSLEDASAKPFGFAGGITIKAGERLTLTSAQFRFALQNSGVERLILKDHTGQIIDNVEYHVSAKTDERFVRSGDLLAPMRLTTNTTTSKTVAAAKSTNTTKKSALKTIPLVSLLDVQAQKQGTIVSVEATVSALPGEIGKKSIYLFDGSEVIEVYAHTIAFPTLQRGDRVRITGEVRQLKNGKRLNISETTQIELLGPGELIPIHLTEDSNEQRVGIPIILEGTLLSLAKGAGVLQSESGEWNLKFAVNIPTPEKGARIELQGLLSGERTLIVTNLKLIAADRDPPAMVGEVTETSPTNRRTLGILLATLMTLIATSPLLLKYASRIPAYAKRLHLYQRT